jgi:urease accessory protein
VSCCSKTERVGRDGFLRLVFERREGRTVLTGKRFTLPLQVLEPSRLADGSLYVMLLNPGGGILGGDRLRTEIVLGAGTHVVLTTPSASKIYRATGPGARCETEISLGQGAILEYLPDHLIPHPGAALAQNLAIRMAPQSCAIVYDAVAAGRIARNERWRFREIRSEISIHFDGAARFLSRSSLTPSSRRVDAAGIMDGFDYFGSIIALRHGAELKANHRALDTAIQEIPDVWGGATSLAAGGLLAKFLAPSADALARTMVRGWSVVRRHMIQLPGFDLRKL